MEVQEEEATNYSAFVRTKAITPNQYRASKPYMSCSSDIPSHTDGLFLPYIPELTKEDKDSVCDVISRYLIKAIGENSTECFAVLNAIRSSMGVIAHTIQGNCLAHMARVFELGMRTQTKPMLLISPEGIYESGYLSGAKYSIQFRSVVYRSFSHQKCLGVYDTIRPHLNMLTQICEELEIGSEEITSMRSLNKVLGEKDVRQSQKDLVKKGAPYLNFNQSYWSVNAQTVQNAMRLIVEYETPIPLDVPLHHSCVLSTDRVELVLGAFGYTAFTLNLRNYPLYKYECQLPPKDLMARICSLEASIADMKEMLGSKGIHNANDRRGVRNDPSDRDMTTKKEEIWRLVQSYVNSKEHAKEQSGKGTTDAKVGGSFFGGDDDW